MKCIEIDNVLITREEMNWRREVDMENQTGRDNAGASNTKLKLENSSNKNLFSPPGPIPILL
jgi:hypothetical protein